MISRNVCAELLTLHMMVCYSSNLLWLLMVLDYTLSIPVLITLNIVIVHAIFLFNHLCLLFLLLRFSLSLFISLDMGMSCVLSLCLTMIFLIVACSLIYNHLYWSIRFSFCKFIGVLRQLAYLRSNEIV